jgi:putative nucleotidyltransferase with HDIG domain
MKEMNASTAVASLPKYLDASKPHVRVPLPPFPAIARKLLGAISQEDCSMRTISNLVGSDAAFSVEVLRLANSAILGLRYEVISIMHAVSVLGTHRLRGLVLTVGLRDFLRTSKHDEVMRRCWRHNLATALVADWMAEFYQQDRGAAYTAGLLHDVGRLALLTMHPGRYLHVLQLHKQTGRDIVQCERETLGQDHREIGAMLAREWKLPVTVTQSVCAQDPGNGGTIDLTDLVSVCCYAAVELGFSMIEAEQEPDVARLVNRIPAAIWGRVEPRLAELKELVPMRINIFETEFLAG